MATLLSDAFTRADSAVSPGTPDVGGPYTVRSGTAGISSNQLYFPTVVGTSVGSHLTFPAAVDAAVQASWPTLTTGVTQINLILRWVDANNMWVLTGSSNTAMRIVRYIGGSELVSVASTVIPTAGQTIGFFAVGAFLYATVAGQIVAAVDDHFYGNGASIAGVGMRSTTIRMDNLLASDSVAVEDTAELVEEFIDTFSNPPEPAWVYKGRDSKALDTVGAA